MQLDPQLQRVARYHLPPEAGAIETAEQWQLARKLGVGQYGNRADLSNRFAHQHTGQRRAPREVPGEEPLIATQTPLTRGADTRFEGDHLIDEQERWPVRQDIGRKRERRHPASASSNRTGVSFGLILYQTLRSLPSGPIRNADRSMPMYVLP